MMSNVALFIACAPLWLLVGVGAGTFSIVLLPVVSAVLPAFTRAFSFQSQKLPDMRPAIRRHVDPAAAMLRPYWPSYGVW
jgi:hypothetical protein